MFGLLVELLSGTLEANVLMWGPPRTGDVIFSIFVLRVELYVLPVQPWLHRGGASEHARA